jgi:hypothetical protein
MNDEKIFSDLLGILKWIEFNRGNDSKPGVNGSKPTIEEGIKEVISFLDIEERDEEVEALKEYLFEKNSNNEFDIQGMTLSIHSLISKKISIRFS